MRGRGELASQALGQVAVLSLRVHQVLQALAERHVVEAVFPGEWKHVLRSVEQL